MIGVALAFLAPWIIALAAFIGAVHGIRRSRRHRQQLCSASAGAGDRGYSCRGSRVECFRATCDARTTEQSPEGLCSCRAAYHSLLEMFMGRKIAKAGNVC